MTLGRVKNTDQAGWVLMPDGRHHYFNAGLAYPWCRTWFDWGRSRGDLDGQPCPDCVHELFELADRVLSEPKAGAL